MAERETRKTLFLIDAMSLVFRAFYAPMAMALVSPSGMPTKAIYIFVRTLQKLLKDHHPDYVAAAFDLAAPTFRDRLFEQYKANRPAFPEELSLQLPFVRRFCRALGIRLIEMEGFEADDLIGTLAGQGTTEGLDVFIVSGDEDLFQLVNDRVRVLKPGRAAGDGETLCDGEKVKEIIGVAPGQVVDWLALTGDPSDNIPGARPLPGREPPLAEGAKKRSYIGPKGATEIIGQFGTLEAALDGFAEVKKQSYREALRDFRAEALLSKDLARIRTDIPLDLTAEDLKLSPPDIEEIAALSRELGFASLLRQFLEQAPVAEIQPGHADALDSDESVRNWLARRTSGAALSVAFTVEGEEGFSGRLGAIGLSDGSRQALLDPAASDSAGFRALGAALADPAVPKRVHNAKLLDVLLSKAGVSLAGVAADTFLYSYLLEPLASSYSLADVVLRRLGRAAPNSAGDAAEAVGQLAAQLAPEIERRELKRLYDEIELPLAAVLARVEQAGVRIDPAILAVMSQAFEKELTELTREIHALAGEPFDIESPKQLGEILFGKLQLPGGKRLKKSGQYSTAAAVLESLAAVHELPRKILDFRTRAKLKSTYVDALPKYINPSTGRLHTSFNQAGSRTGRLSSSDPNLQNIPIGDEFGLRIRSAFVAEPGWRLIAADYSQIELRILAHLSEDPLLIQAFAHDEDIHARTAEEIFSVPPALQTHEHRRMAKAINYGVIYGLSAFGLKERTGASQSDAQHYIDEYFRRYRGVKEYLGRLIEQARATGEVRTLFGRLRPIPEINSPDNTARNRAEREAMNTPLQGAAADLMKLAMVKLDARLAREHLRARIIMTVHDELVVEAPDEEAGRAEETVRAVMESVYPLKVPLRVDVGSGKNWREAKQ